MRNLCDVSLYLDSFLLLRLETYQSIRKSPPNLSLSATRSENNLKFKLIGLQKKTAAHVSKNISNVANVTATY